MPKELIKCSFCNFVSWKDVLDLVLGAKIFIHLRFFQIVRCLSFMGIDIGVGLKWSSVQRVWQFVSLSTSPLVTNKDVRASVVECHVQGL